MSAEQIQAEFYCAETQGEDTRSNSTFTTGSSGEGHNSKMYRDVFEERGVYAYKVVERLGFPEGQP